MDKFYLTPDGVKDFQTCRDTRDFVKHKSSSQPFVNLPDIIPIVYKLTDKEYATAVMGCSMHYLLGDAMFGKITVRARDSERRFELGALDKPMSPKTWIDHFEKTLALLSPEGELPKNSKQLNGYSFDE